MRRLSTIADYEMWVAAHDGCGPDGCGSCVVLGIDIDAELLGKIRRVARILRMPIDVFMYQAVAHGLAMACE